MLEGFGGDFSMIFYIFCKNRDLIKPTSDINKTLAGVVRNAHRSFRAAGRNRSKIDPRVLPSVFGDMNGSHQRLGSSFGAFWSVLAVLGPSRERSRRCWGRPESALGASRAHFFESLKRRGGVQGRPRSGLDCPKPPKSDFWLNLLDFLRILHGSGVDVGRIWGRFVR